MACAAPALTIIDDSAIYHLFIYISVHFKVRMASK